jgi:hypothetical protein
LWALLARLGRERWPALLRGDLLGLPVEARSLGREPEDWASEAHLSRAEQDGLPYLFKLRTTRRACPRA